MKLISENARIHPGVTLSMPCRVDDFCVLGMAPDDGGVVLEIGPGCHIRSHTVIYAGSSIGRDFATGHSALVRESNRIGDRVSIGSHAVVEHHAVIGSGVRLHTGAFVPEYTVLEDEAWIGPRAVLTNTRHPKCVNMPRCLEPVTVKRGAKIGANATVLPGVVIGEMAVVAAGAVVTKDVEPRMVVAGNPARVISSIDDLKCSLDRLTAPYGGLSGASGSE